MSSYASVIKSLLPPGRFWEITRSSEMERIILGLAGEFERIRQLLDQLPQLFSKEVSKERLLILLNEPRGDKDFIDLILKRNGNLSRNYIESRLNSLGFKNYRIFDPTETDFGIEPVINQNLVGMIFITVQIPKLTTFTAGALCGSPVCEWRDLAFESAVRSILPAHTQSKWIYKSKEAFHASSQ
jgi:hypothetical protein